MSGHYSGCCSFRVGRQENKSWKAGWQPPLLFQPQPISQDSLQSSASEGGSLDVLSPLEAGLYIHHRVL